MELKVSFPGGARVDAHFGPYTVRTDQPAHGGGEASAPTPWATFLASLATCAGIYVLGFCRQRDLPTEGLYLTQETEANRETGLVERIRIDIHVPESFPEKYRDALIRSAQQCAVKRHMDHPPQFAISTVVDSAAAQD